MKILSAEQIRDWDAYTIAHEPIASADLMERAAAKCVEWIVTKGWEEKTVRVFCGKGNNGGDGLVIARLLFNQGYAVSVYILEFGKIGSDDFQANLHRLHELPFNELHFVQSPEQFPAIEKDNIVIDALFGTGLNKALDGLAAQLVQHINKSKATIVSIDLPSGLFAGQSSADSVVIAATHTLTFQVYKTALLVQENASHIGEVAVLDIGLHPAYLNGLDQTDELLEAPFIKRIYKPRQRFAHKGSFGHALLTGGSLGKMGAIVLATRACLRAGAGLTTALVPKCGYEIIQLAAPEAMALTDAEDEHLSTFPDHLEKFNALAFGPGAGTHPQTQNLLSFLLRRYQKPMVIDADGLNCLAQNKDWLSLLPSRSVLTPHPKEFDRLFGEHQTDFDRIATARAKAKELDCVVVLKSHHSFIASPGGQGYFNSTGNAGMAKGGSGDVLTGILAALLAQGYEPLHAALLGVYLHGVAGELAAARHSQESMLPGDLIEVLGEAFRKLA